MSLLTLSAIGAGVCAVYYFWSGTRPYDPFRRWARIGAPVFLFLSAFSGYFAWREAHTLDEIATIISPVPEVTGVMRVPSPAELQAVANALGAVQGEGRFGTTKEERQTLAEDIKTIQSRYWKLHTALSPEAAIEFYRVEAGRGGWEVEVDQPPYLKLVRGAEGLVLFIQDDWKKAETAVWYIYGPRR